MRVRLRLQAGAACAGHHALITPHAHLLLRLLGRSHSLHAEVPHIPACVLVRCGLCGWSAGGGTRMTHPSCFRPKQGPKQLRPPYNLQAALKPRALGVLPPLQQHPRGAPSAFHQASGRAQRTRACQTSPAQSRGTRCLRRLWPCSKLDVACKRQSVAGKSRQPACRGADSPWSAAHTPFQVSGQ